MSKIWWLIVGILIFYFIIRPAFLLAEKSGVMK